MPDRKKVETFIHAKGHFNQSELIAKIKDKLYESDEIKNGICLMLSINWLFEMLDGKAPVAIVEALNKDFAKNAGTYAKQVAGQQRACQKIAHLDASPTEFAEVLLLASSKKYTTKRFLDFEVGKGNGVGDWLDLAVDSWKSEDAVLVVMEVKGGAHAIAARKLMKGWVIFDPNFGCFVPEDKFGMAMKEIELFYVAKRARLFAISKH